MHTLPLRCTRKGRPPVKLLNRISIAWQLTILAVLIAGAAIVILSQAVLSRGREVLLTHELVDLGDDANLRMYDLRDQIRYLQFQVRGVVNKLGEPFKRLDKQKKEVNAAVARSVIRSDEIRDIWAKDWKKVLQEDPPAEADGTFDDRQTRDRLARRSLDGSTVREAYWFKLSETGAELLATWRVGQKDLTVVEPGQERHVPGSIRSLATTSYFTRQLPSLSPPVLEAIDPSGEGDRRCYFSLITRIWVNANTVPLVLAVRIDLTQYFANLARNSPRHHFLLTDSDSTVMVHPLAERVGEKLSARKSEKWHFRLPEAAADVELADEDWMPPFDTATEAQLMRTAGTRLRPPDLRPGQAAEDVLTRAFMDLGAEYGYFHARRGLPSFEKDFYEGLNQFLRKLSANEDRDGYPRFRFSEPTREAPHLLISVPGKEPLRRLEGEIDGWIRANHPGPAGGSWTRPIDCRNFTAFLVRARLVADTEEGTNPRSQFQLIVLASKEEIEDDINDAITQVGFTWGLGVLLGAGGLALLCAMWLTRPLKRITEASEKLAGGEYDLDLKVRGPSEVSKLATSFASMAVQIRHRGEELNKNLERIQTILKTAAEGIIVFNNHGRILEANLAAVKMFGYAAEADMKDRRADELLELPMKLSDPGQSSLHNKKDGESVHVFDEVLRIPSEIRRGARADGSYFWIEVGFSKLSSQKLYTGIFRDVSARKEAEEMRQKAEEELKQLNAELDHRVTQRTHELSLALEQSKAAKRATDTFVANMSHELRQPLNIIIGFTEAQLDEPDGFDPDTVAGDLKKTLMAAKHLLDMINDLLDLAKIEAGMLALSVAEFELPKLVEMLRVLAEPLMVKNQNKLVISIDPSVKKMRADERRVKQILINLLSNAAKFTDKGRVELQVAPEIRDGRPGLAFRVIDTGKGMSSEQASRLFQRFYQVDDTTTRSQGGTGLGLAISRSLCKLMDGEIGATSEPGKGSIFTLWLPGEVTSDPSARPSHPDLKRAPALAHALPGANGSEARSKVLVVDDDDRVRELMERFLTKEGFQVLTAPNGVEGLRMAKELHPSVITLDVMMPGIDGWGILAALKTDATTQNIPVVIVSMVDEPNRGFALGASDYINKPIDWTRLGGILKRYIRGEATAPILVIEDDEATRGLLRRFLEKEGFGVVEAENGKEGLARYREGKPAAILMDVGMPVMDGFQFVEELRKLDPLHSAPVIVLTGKDLSAAEQQRLTGGVSQILQKGAPENMEALLHLLHREIRNVLHRQQEPTENAHA